jgi:hypothetical protein
MKLLAIANDDFACTAESSRVGAQAQRAVMCRTFTQR